MSAPSPDGSRSPAGSPDVTAGLVAAADRYDQAAAKVSRLVLREYSTSFGLATRLLARDMRLHIANIYGLVRIADEIVDGPAHSLTVDARRDLLDRLEDDVRRAYALGYSANPVVHSFARTAARFGITEDLTAPFFASMRADLTLMRCTQQEFETYVYGSAEVVGLMCLRVFLGAGPVEPARRARLEHGARRLGSAFQTINFLRDLGEDYRTLGRSYFPSVPDGDLDEPRKLAITTSIRADLAAARRTLAEIPPGARPAVTAALRLFEELTGRIERLPAAEVIDRRIRVSNAVKARVLAQALRESRRAA